MKSLLYGKKFKLDFIYYQLLIINVFNLIRFSWLPVVEDDEEATHIYNYLCDLIQSNHVAVLGNNNSNLPRIVSIIAEAFHSDVIKVRSEEGTRMLSIVKQIESNAEVFQACISVLTPEQKEGLEEAYQELANAPA